MEEKDARVFVNPRGWQLEEISGCCDLIKDGTHAPPKRVDIGVPLLSAVNVKEGKIDFTNNVTYITEHDYDSIHKNFVIKIGDILLTIVGSIGRTALVNTGRKFSVQRSICVLRPSTEKLDGLFFYHILNSEFVQEQLKRRANTTAQSGIYLNELGKVRIPLPSISEQRKIAGILEKAVNLKDLRHLANRLTSKIIQSVFLKMFGDPAKNPNGWEEVQFREFAIIERRGVLPKDIANGTRYIGLEHIEKDTGEILDFVEVDKGQIKSNKFAFTPGHILYGKLRPYLNKVALPSFAGVCSTDILPILPKPGIATKSFVAFLMKHPYFVRYATKKSTGANLPRISPEEIKRFETPLPPLDLQQQFSYFITGTQGVSTKQKQSTTGINELFHSLMHKAFSGELAN